MSTKGEYLRNNSDIVGRFEDVEDRIRRACKRSGRDPSGVKIVAISKGQSPVKISQAVSEGIAVLGESKPQEFREKASLLADYHDITWHFVGHLQENKVRLVVGHCSLIHSVASLSLAEAISERSCQMNIRTPVLIQVNISGEKDKHGVEPRRAGDLVSNASDLAGISVGGLMTMAPHVPNPESVRPIFRQLSQLAEDIDKEVSGCSLEELSMGMTNDFEVAVEEGATLVRVGQAIFGPRDQ